MIVVVFDEGRYAGTDVTRSELDAWVTSLKIPFSTLRDPDGAPLRAEAVLGGKDTSYVVERSTRRIVAKRLEFEGGVVASLGDLNRL